MKNVVLLFLLLASLALGRELGPEKSGCADQMKALFELPTEAKIESPEFQNAVLKKAQSVGDRSKLVGWLCDSAEKQRIGFRMGFLDRDISLSITAVEGGRIHVANVQVRFDGSKMPKAAYSTFQDQGPVGNEPNAKAAALP